MPNTESLAGIAQMHLIKTVDTARVAGDPFKLPTFIRTQHDADLDGLETADGNAALSEGDRAGGSAAARDALTKLEDYLREGYNFITAIRASQITDAQRLEVFTEYGWAGGLIGKFSDGRVIGLTRLAVQAHPGIAPGFCYPADLVADLTAQLAVFDANAPVATGGQRSAATRVRDAKLDLAKTSLAQVRFYYCSASRDTDQTPELAKIGFQPRRAPGTVSTGNKPAPAPAPAAK
jgi:hypothetical protein